MAWITSLIVDVMLLASLAAFWRVWDTTNNPIMACLLRGFVWIIAAWLSRSLYWDVVQFAIGREAWVMVRDALGGQGFSFIFNLMAIRGMYWILRAKLEMIPAEKRGKYRWWNAWLYPPNHRRFCITGADKE